MIFVSFYFSENVVLLEHDKIMFLVRNMLFFALKAHRRHKLEKYNLKEY